MQPRCGQRLVELGAISAWRGSVGFGFSVVSISAPYPVNVTRMKRAADLRKVGDVLPPHFMPV